MNQLHSIQDINNGMLKSAHSMPQKDSTSDGTSSFSMSRAIYAKRFPTVPASSLQNKKKWLGNRDASKVIANRHYTAVGQGSINNANTQMSFTTYKDVNVVNDAIRRTRSAGYVAPVKTNFIKIGMTPHFRPVAPNYKNYMGVKYPVTYH